jgi:dolichol-phosphate mannosyltransferase
MLRRRYMPGANRELASRLGKFLVVGGTGVVVNNAALYAFYQILRLPLAVASAFAVTLAIGNNFVLNDRWTFHQSRHAGLRRFARFSVVSVGGLAITTLTLWSLVTYLDVQYLVANVIGIGLGAGSNFVANLMWTWSRSSDQ